MDSHDHTDLNIKHLPDDSCCVRNDFTESTTKQEIDAYPGTTLVITDIPCNTCPVCGTAFTSTDVVDVMIRTTELLRVANAGRIVKTYSDLPGADV